jgi:Uma2 family endonuclease
VKNKKQPKQIKEEMESYAASELEFLGMEEDRFEIIEGVRYDLKPAPSVNHQKISGGFYIALHETCHSNGTILYAPIDLYIDEDNQFQPDLVFILHEHDSIIKEKRIEGAPDLVLEILSPSTSQNDKIHKKRQYERFGINEYWIVDPIHCTVDQFVLEKEAYVLYCTYGLSDHLSSPTLPCISIDLDKVFSAKKF